MTLFIRNNYKKYWFVILANLLILFFYLVFFDCCYEVNDDFQMKMIASGAYGIPDYHLNFINVLYGYILVALYNFIPTICWYDVIQLIVLMFAFSNITYVLLNKKREINPHLIYLLICILSYSFYVWLQFTKTAAVVTCAGYLCILNYLENDNKLMQINGIIMTTFAIWLRLKHFLACSVLCIALFIVPLCEDYFNVFKKLVRTAVLCIVILLSSIAINNIEYSSEKWKTYRDYRSEIAQLTDFGWPNFEENIKVYDEIELDENAFNLYSTWNYNDTFKFNFKEIDILLNARNKKISIPYILRFIYRLCIYCVNTKSISYMVVLVIILLLFYIFSSQKKYKTNLAVVYLLLAEFLLIMYCYFIRLDRFLDRIEISYIFIMLISLIYLTNFDGIYIKVKSIKCLCLVCLIICCLFRMECINSRFFGVENIDTDTKEIYDEVVSDPDHLYIFKVYENIEHYDFNLLNNPDKSKFVNITGLGGWMSNNPLLQNCLKKFDVSNPYKDVINNKKAYICTKDINPILQYLKTYYSNSLIAEEVKKIKDYTVYRIKN